MNKQTVCEVAKAYRDTDSLTVCRLYRPEQDAYCLTGALLNEAGVPKPYLRKYSDPQEFRVPFVALSTDTMHAIARRFSQASLLGQETISGQGILMVMYGLNRNKTLQLMEANDWAGYVDVGSERSVYDCLMDVLACDGESVEY